jgi:epoxide hydrolase-like predicted phosphatase
MAMSEVKTQIPHSPFHIPHLPCRPFLYFDLGNVLLFFDHRRAARQMAQLIGCQAERIWDCVFAGGLNAKLDAGEVTSEDFYEAVCRHFNCRPDRQTLATAFAEIFEINVSMNAVVAQLKAAGYRLGLLSNTCELHWDYFASGRYALIPSAFDVVVLSCRLKLMKPGVEIYHAAAELAGVRPEEVFYIDDIMANVDGARAAGFDAVQYTTTRAFVAELRRRSVLFNY